MPAYLDRSRSLKRPPVLTLYEYPTACSISSFISCTHVTTWGGQYSLSLLPPSAYYYYCHYYCFHQRYYYYCYRYPRYHYTYSAVYTTIIVPINICNITAGCGLVGSASMLLLLTPPKLLPAAVPVVLEYSRFVVR